MLRFLMNLQKPLFAGLFSTFLLFLSSSAYAQSTPGQTSLAQEPVYQDDITLELKAEDWLTSQSARLFVNIVAAFDEQQSANLRNDVLKKLKAVAPKADWKITRFNRSASQSGLEQWYISAESRLSEKDMDGIRSKIERSSKPGFKMTLRNITYSPTTAEKETIYADLRKKIYLMAQKEVQSLNDIFSDRSYRISRIDFSPSAIQYAHRQRVDRLAEAQTFSVSKDQGPEDLNVSQKIKLHASVIISSNHLPARSK